MEAKEQQHPSGLAATTNEGSERKASSNATRGRKVGPTESKSAATNEGTPQSSRRKHARPLPLPQQQKQTTPPPAAARGSGVADHGPAAKRPQRPRPSFPRGGSGNMGVGGRPPRPATLKHRPVNPPNSSSAPLNPAPSGNSSISGGGGGGGPRSYRPRPPRPVRPASTATVGSAPGMPESATAASASIGSAGQAGSVRPGPLSPHVAQSRPRPRPDLATTNSRVRPKHKPAATASVAAPTVSATIVPEDSVAPATLSKPSTPPQATPQKLKQGPKDSPKKRMAAPSLAKAESISDRPATPTRKQRKAGEPSGSASQPQLASPLKDMDRKPVTKVSIRWLPVDLPEHVFWRSVEPALPWFDPQNVGSLVQKERTVLRELCTHFETVSTDVEATLDQVETEGDAQAPMAADDLPSSKGATTTTMFDVYESQNLVRLDSEPYWRAFVPGKQHRSKAKPADPARAYILFATPAEVDHFYKNYHGHVFSKNGVVSRAAVELAAFQHVPWSVVSASTSDMLSGTIDEDPDFIAFLAMDPNAADDGVKGDAATAEGVKPLSHMSYAAAASSSSANAKSEGDTAAETTTPLINYLRELKGMPAARSSAKSPASTPNRSGDVTPKKARRRNR